MKTTSIYNKNGNWIATTDLDTLFSRCISPVRIDDKFDYFECYDIEDNAGDICNFDDACYFTPHGIFYGHPESAKFEGNYFIAVINATCNTTSECDCLFKAASKIKYTRACYRENETNEVLIIVETDYPGYAINELHDEIIHFYNSLGVHFKADYASHKSMIKVPGKNDLFYNPNSCCFITEVAKFDDHLKDVLEVIGDTDTCIVENDDELLKIGRIISTRFDVIGRPYFHCVAMHYQLNAEKINEIYTRCMAMPASEVPIDYILQLARKNGINTETLIKEGYGRTY